MANAIAPQACQEVSVLERSILALASLNAISKSPESVDQEHFMFLFDFIASDLVNQFDQVKEVVGL